MDESQTLARTRIKMNIGNAGAGRQLYIIGWPSSLDIQRRF